VCRVWRVCFPSLPDGGRCPENPGRALPRPRRERGRDAVWDFKTLPSRHGLIPMRMTTSIGSRSLREKESKGTQHRARVRVSGAACPPPLFLTEGAAPKIPVALFPDLGESEGETRSGISRTLPSRQELIPAGRTSTGSRSPIEKESKRRQFSCARVCRVACLSPSCARACVSSVACLFPSLPDGGRCPGNPGRALPRPRRERGRDAVWDFKNAPLSPGTHTCGKDCVYGI
jgi:hypothetical protein